MRKRISIAITISVLVAGIGSFYTYKKENIFLGKIARFLASTDDDSLKSQLDSIQSTVENIAKRNSEQFKMMDGLSPFSYLRDNELLKLTKKKLKSIRNELLIISTRPDIRTDSAEGIQINRIVVDYLNALTEINRLYVKMAHMPLLDKTIYDFSWDELDDLNLYIGKKYAMNILYRANFSARHIPVKELPIDISASNIHPEIDTVVQLSLSMEMRQMLENLVMDTPANDIDYARYVHFTATREMLVNTWAINRLHPDKYQDKPSYIDKNHENGGALSFRLGDDLTMTSSRYYKDLENADTYYNVVAPMINRGGVINEMTVSDTKNNKLMSIATPKEYGEIIRSLAWEDKNLSFINDYLTAKGDFFLTGKEWSEKDFLDIEEFNGDSVLKVEENYWDKQRGFLSFSVFIDDPLEPKKIAKRLAEDIFYWRSLAIADQITDTFMNLTQSIPIFNTDGTIDRYDDKSAFDINQRKLIHDRVYEILNQHFFNRFVQKMENKFIPVLFEEFNYNKLISKRRTEKKQNIVNSIKRHQAIKSLYIKNYIDEHGVVPPYTTLLAPASIEELMAFVGKTINDNPQYEGLLYALENPDITKVLKSFQNAIAKDLYFSAQDKALEQIKKGEELTAADMSDLIWKAISKNARDYYFKYGLTYDQFERYKQKFETDNKLYQRDALSNIGPKQFVELSLSKEEEERLRKGWEDFQNKEKMTFEKYIGMVIANYDPSKDKLNTVRDATQYLQAEKDADAFLKYYQLKENAPVVTPKVPTKKITVNNSKDLLPKYLTDPTSLKSTTLEKKEDSQTDNMRDKTSTFVTIVPIDPGYSGELSEKWIKKFDNYKNGKEEIAWDEMPKVTDKNVPKKDKEKVLKASEENSITNDPLYDKRLSSLMLMFQPFIQGENFNLNASDFQESANEQNSQTKVRYKNVDSEKYKEAIKLKTVESALFEMFLVMGINPNELENDKPLTRTKLWDSPACQTFLAELNIKKVYMEQSLLNVEHFDTTKTTMSFTDLQTREKFIYKTALELMAEKAFIISSGLKNSDDLPESIKKDIIHDLSSRKVDWIKVDAILEKTIDKAKATLEGNAVKKDYISNGHIIYVYKNPTKEGLLETLAKADSNNYKDDKRFRFIYEMTENMRNSIIMTDTLQKHQKSKTTLAELDAKLASTIYRVERRTEAVITTVLMASMFAPSLMAPLFWPKVLNATGKMIRNIPSTVKFYQNLINSYSWFHFIGYGVGKEIIYKRLYEIPTKLDAMRTQLPPLQNDEINPTNLIFRYDSMDFSRIRSYGKSVKLDTFERLDEEIAKQSEYLKDELKERYWNSQLMGGWAKLFMVMDVMWSAHSLSSTYNLFTSGAKIAKAAETLGMANISYNQKVQGIFNKAKFSKYIKEKGLIRGSVASAKHVIKNIQYLHGSFQPYPEHLLKGVDGGGVTVPVRMGLIKTARDLSKSGKGTQGIFDLKKTTEKISRAMTDMKKDASGVFTESSKVAGEFTRTNESLIASLDGQGKVFYRVFDELKNYQDLRWKKFMLNKEYVEIQKIADRVQELIEAGHSPAKIEQLTGFKSLLTQPNEFFKTLFNGISTESRLAKFQKAQPGVMKKMQYIFKLGGQHSFETNLEKYLNMRSSMVKTDVPKELNKMLTTMLWNYRFPKTPIPINVKEEMKWMEYVIIDFKFGEISNISDATARTERIAKEAKKIADAYESVAFNALPKMSVKQKLGQLAENLKYWEETQSHNIELSKKIQQLAIKTKMHENQQIENLIKKWVKLNESFLESPDILQENIAELFVQQLTSSELMIIQRAAKSMPNNIVLQQFLPIFEADKILRRHTLYLDYFQKIDPLLITETASASRSTGGLSPQDFGLPTHQDYKGLPRHITPNVCQDCSIYQQWIKSIDYDAAHFYPKDPIEGYDAVMPEEIKDQASLILEMLNDLAKAAGGGH